MSPSTPPSQAPGAERRFDDREVGLIIRRAAELQRSELARTDPGGMSLAELEQVAREAGLDPALVRRAALEMDVAPPSRASALAGAPTRIVLERVFEGELPERAYESLVTAIRRLTDDQGQVSTIGRTLSWSPSSFGAGHHATPRRLLVTVAVREGRTELRIEERFGQLAGGLFGGLVGGLGGGGFGLALGVGIGVLHSAAAATGIFGGMLLASYGAARGIFVLSVNRKRRQLEALRDRLSEQITQALDAQRPPRLSATGVPDAPPRLPPAPEP